MIAVTRSSRSRGRRHGPGESRVRGQALVEFALVAPIFFLVLLSIVEFGRYIYTVQILNDAAREGARYAIVHGSQSLCPSGPMPGGLGVVNPCDPNGQNVKNVVVTTSTGVTGVSASMVNVSWPVNNSRGNRVTVSVTYQYQSLIPIVPLPPVTINGDATLVINH
jgi:Flp pilus assembly protein TadG